MFLATDLDGVRASVNEKAPNPLDNPLSHKSTTRGFGGVARDDVEATLGPAVWGKRRRGGKQRQKQ